MPDAASLVPDEQFQGLIKWTIKPIVFGGSPTEDENMTWVDLPKHQELVRWWNETYRSVSQE